MHDCAGREARRLVKWRGDVIKKLKHLIGYTRKIGDDASALRAQMQKALGAMCVRHPTGERYEALRNVVGGAVVRWGANAEKHDKEHNTHLVYMVMGIQSLFIYRTTK